MVLATHATLGGRFEPFSNPLKQRRNSQILQPLCYVYPANGYFGSNNANLREFESHLLRHSFVCTVRRHPLQNVVRTLTAPGRAFSALLDITIACYNGMGFVAQGGPDAGSTKDRNASHLRTSGGRNCPGNSLREERAFERRSGYRRRSRTVEGHADEG